MQFLYISASLNESGRSRTLFVLQAVHLVERSSYVLKSAVSRDFHQDLGYSTVNNSWEYDGISTLTWMTQCCCIVPYLASTRKINYITCRSPLHLCKYIIKGLYYGVRNVQKKNAQLKEEMPTEGKEGQ